MRTLILGGTGLISTAITAQLLARGDEVTHLTRGHTPAAAGVRTVHGDRGDLDALRGAWGDGHDAVVDMLCFGADDAAVAVRAFGGTGVRYVLCSTVDVYTKPAAYLPVDEEHERAPQPCFRYAYGKALAEEVLQRVHATGEIDLVTLRPAATYLDQAVPSVGSFDLALERLRAGAPIILHGDGTGLWAACHRDDVAAAFVAATTATVASGRAYHITGDELLTWHQYWTAVADALGVWARFVHIPTDLLFACAPRFAEWCYYNFQFDNVFDNSAAARDLGFACRTRWADGIAAGLVSRPPRPVDPAERDTYTAVLDAWHRACRGMSSELSGKDLVR
ncbi:MAG TPA: NAD-dependent epimerase/dehydratase family protein [Micromonosporaceae bacterium]|jgi:nucleoside-diphosphate-sugar epimerase